MTTEHTVFLDRLDWANPPSWYEFPNLAAAEKFAAAQACLHPQRAVTIQPTVQNLNTTTEMEILTCDSSLPLLALD